MRRRDGGQSGRELATSIVLLGEQAGSLRDALVSCPDGGGCVDHGVEQSSLFSSQLSALEVADVVPVHVVELLKSRGDDLEVGDFRLAGGDASHFVRARRVLRGQVELQRASGCESSWLRLTSRLDGAGGGGHDVARGRYWSGFQVVDDSSFWLCFSQQLCGGLSSILNRFAGFLSIVELFFELVVLLVRAEALDNSCHTVWLRGTR